MVPRMLDLLCGLLLDRLRRVAGERGAFRSQRGRQGRAQLDLAIQYILETAPRILVHIVYFSPRSKCSNLSATRPASIW